MEYQTLSQKFKEVASKFKEKVALQKKDLSHLKTYTFGQIKESSLKIGNFLLHRGIRNNKISLSCPNGPEWVTIYFGILESGSTVVPIDYSLPKEEIISIIIDSESCGLFCSQNVFHKIKGSLKNLSQIKFIILTDGEPREENVISLRQLKKENIPAPNTPPRISIDDVASLLYTSGTTAKPRGVMLTHKNLYANFHSLSSLNICTPQDNVLSVLPLHHSYAFTVTLMLPLFCGAKITYIDSLRTDLLLSAMRETKVTLMAVVPELLNVILNSIHERIKRLPLALRAFVAITKNVTFTLSQICGANLSRLLFKNIHSRFGGCLRFLVSGGAKLSPSVALELMKFGFRLFEGYGLTETSPVVALGKKTRKKISSVGRPIKGVNVRIDNPDKHNIGEILISGDNVMKGYYKRPEETARVIKDGWFHSGDLGFIDSSGYLYITGRIKDVIVLSSGKNIYPEEIEEYYRKSPYIKEICVIDVTQRQKSGLYGVIVPDYDYFRKMQEIKIADKIKWEVENLAKKAPLFRHLMGFIIVKEPLPKTALGKIKRYEVKSRYENLISQKQEAVTKKEVTLPEDKEMLKDKLTQQILDCLKKELKKDVSLYDHLEFDLGVDSLTRVNLQMCLQNLLNLDIPDEIMASVYTVKELISELKKLSSPETIKVKKKTEIMKWEEILKINPDQEIMKKIQLKANLLERCIIFIGILLVKLLCKTVFLLKVSAKENLPPQAPYILCPNHTSFLDGFLIKSALPYSISKNLFFLGFDFKFYHLPLIRNLVKLSGIIPVNPAENLIPAMQVCSLLIKQGKILCIFPEGRRGIEDKPQEFKKGIGILAEELGVTLLPVYIKGALSAWPRTSRFPRPHPTRVTFGKPVNPKELEKIKAHLDKNADIYESVAQLIRARVEGLSKDPGDGSQ